MTLLWPPHGMKAGRECAIQGHIFNFDNSTLLWGPFVEVKDPIWMHNGEASSSPRQRHGVRRCCAAM